jgi:hypothetical protein
MRNLKSVPLPLLGLIAFSAFLPWVSTAQDHLPSVLRADYEGTVGSNRIQMTLLIQDGKLIPPSHYFYQKDRADIPLVGSVGPTLTFTEPNGGAFSLEFKQRASGQRHELSFNENVALSGTWTGGNGRTYPVALRILFAGPAPAQPADCQCPQ